MSVRETIQRWPLVVLAPRHAVAVRWAMLNGFDPIDERQGRLILIDYAGGDRTRGIRDGTYVIVRGGQNDLYFEQWLMRAVEMLRGPCAFRELYNWDDALDGAMREVAFEQHFAAHRRIFQAGP